MREYRRNVAKMRQEFVVYILHTLASAGIRRRTSLAMARQFLLSAACTSSTMTQQCLQQCPVLPQRWQEVL